MDRHEIEIRVRYCETDGQGRVHHAQYLNYLERGRVEMLRAAGRSYRELEEQGILLVVSNFQLTYRMPAQFDDLLLLSTEVLYSRGARIEHAYRLTRQDDVVLEARSEIACIDRTGRIRRLPDFLQQPRGRSTMLRGVD
jgi:acyl-CoA thioester hydrolase